MNHDPEACDIVAHRLGRLPHFRDLVRPGREALARAGTLRDYRRDDQVLTEGQSSDSLFLVLRGRLKMSRATPVGRNVILALFGPGEVFGAVAALSTHVADASVTAIEDCQCLELSAETVLELFSAHPELVRSLLPLLTRQLVECKNCLVELTGYRVEIRFAHLFLRLGERLGRPQPQGILLPLDLSRQELADMTGTTIETCIRLMSRWRTEGIVETSSQGFLIRDTQALAMLAEGNDYSQAKTGCS